MYSVAVVKYERPFDSLKQAVELCGGFGDLSVNSKVFIKPNIVVWHEEVNFPKYGVLTTSRLIEDMVRLLNEQGVTDISVVEGIVEAEKSPKRSTLEIAAKGLGLDLLRDRYGVKFVDVMKSRFTKILVNGHQILVNADISEADYVIDMPVLKTHTQAKVSLGIKNLKGLLNTSSRKFFHNADREMDLNYQLAKLPEIIPVNLTVLDGIYTLEMGPLYTGIAHRSDIIIASKDLISADKVGAKALGIEPEDVPHIAFCAKAKGRKPDLSDVNIKGEIDVRKVLKPHRWALEQNETGDLPMFFEKAGIKGIRFPEMDNTLCTYGTHFINYIIMGIITAKNKNRTFDDVEILYGKIQTPTLGHKHTILVGQCQVKLNSDHPAINHCVKIRGCPPRKDDFVAAFEEVGIQLKDDFLEWIKKSPELHYMKRYEGNPKFDPTFYAIHYNEERSR